MVASQLEEPLSENDFYLEIQRQKNTHTKQNTRQNWHKLPQLADLL